MGSRQAHTHPRLSTASVKERSAGGRRAHSSCADSEALTSATLCRLWSSSPCGARKIGKFVSTSAQQGAGSCRGASLAMQTVRLTVCSSQVGFSMLAEETGQEPQQAK